MPSKSVETEESAPLLGEKNAEEVKSIYCMTKSRTQQSEDGRSYTGDNDEEVRPKSYFNAESLPNSIGSEGEDSEKTNEVRKRAKKEKDECKTGKEPSPASVTAVEPEPTSFPLLTAQSMPSVALESHSTDGSPRIDIFRKLRQFPYGAYVILLAEFCHSFTSYALRTILYYYLIQKIMLSEEEAGFYAQVYLFFTHLFPIVGCILADGFFGLYRTMIYLILIYGIGQVLMIVSSSFGPNQTFVHPWLDLIGLILISVGTGAIRPCMAAFGGDQFEKADIKLRSTFFAFLYTAFNLGCILGGATAPLMRDVSCLSERSCYPLPFGASTLVLFMMMFDLMVGYKCLRSVHEVKENIFAAVAKTIWTALKNKKKHHAKPVGCWLNHALDEHECDTPTCKKVTLINDIRTVGKIFIIFLPIPMFWTLFDQQYNNFYKQGNEMDLRLGKNLYILPDQMPVFNMFLVVILLPISHFVIYPLARLCCRTTYLRKMSAGMLMASASFLIMSVIQIHLDTRNPFNYYGKASLAVKNMLNVPVDVSYNNGSKHTTTSDTLVRGLLANQFKNDVDDVYIFSGTFKIFYELRPASFPSRRRTQRMPRVHSYDQDKTFTFEEMKHYLIVIKQEGIFIVQTQVEKPTSGQAESFQSVLFVANNSTPLPNIAFCRNDYCDPSSVKNFAVFTPDDILQQDCCKEGTEVSLSKVKNLIHGTWCVYTEDDGEWKNEKFCFERDAVGGVYILMVQIFDNSTRKFSSECLVPDNKVHILWQMVPYTFLTIGEILFVVTGMEFSYAEAAPTMKSIVQAIWNTNMAVGNLIFLLLSYIMQKVNLNDTPYVFLICALLMLFCSFGFILLAQFYYTYVEEDAD